MDNLKIVAPVLAIAEGTEYSQHLVGVEYNSSFDATFKLAVKCEMHLWQVVLAKDNSIHYCIAESAEAAFGQCTSEGLLRDRGNGSAIQLPMRVRGWGSQVF